MSRPLLCLTTLAILTACASRSRPSNSTEARADGAVSYRCESGERFMARIDGVSALVQYNGIASPLPQLANVAGVQSYSDGRHRLEIRQGRTWFGPNGAPLRQCTPQ